MLHGFLDLRVLQHRYSAVLELGHEFGPCQRLVWITLGNLNELVPPRAIVQHDLHDIWTIERVHALGVERQGERLVCPTSQHPIVPAAKSRSAGLEHQLVQALVSHRRHCERQSGALRVADEYGVIFEQRGDRFDRLSPARWRRLAVAGQLEEYDSPREIGPDRVMPEGIMPAPRLPRRTNSSRAVRCRTHACGQGQRRRRE